MNVIDIILDKRYGRELNDEQIAFFVKGVTDGSIPDYQASALLMAIVLNGMNEREMTTLTLEMARSGEQNDLSFVGDITVDKHSTGGVGDKITPLVMPLCSSFGVKIVKLTGRGLGFTGGTVDKFSSIEGFDINVPQDRFGELVRSVGVVISGQTPDLAPADKILYALRDVTGTVDSIPLIASSIMSKKLAGGADAIVLDVTCGSGAYMNNADRARDLAKAMIRIGNLAGRRTVAVITDMDQPLGRCCGNIMEMEEVWDTLSGKGEEDVVDIATVIASKMIMLADKQGQLTPDELIEELRARLNDGRARDEFVKLIRSQGGLLIDGVPVYRDRPNKIFEVRSKRDGYVRSIRTDEIGYSSVMLGAGRLKKDDEIDYGAGIKFIKKRGDQVSYGDVLCELYVGTDSVITPDSNALKEIADKVFKAYNIMPGAPEKRRSVIDVLEQQ